MSRSTRWLMRSILAMLAAGALPAHAQTTSARDVAALEYAFAARARAAGVNTAFREYLAADGFVFRPEKVNAREFYAMAPESPGLLLWEPELADVSAAGDLGWTTGPWEARASADAPAVARGYFLTVWQRQQDGTFRAVVDHGVRMPVAPAVDSLVIWQGDVVSSTTSSADALRALDARLGADTPAGTVHERVRTYALAARHDGAAARAAALAALETASHGVGVSESGDVAYSWGSYTLGEERGHYVRIWRRAGEQWRVIVEAYGR